MGSILFTAVTSVYIRPKTMQIYANRWKWNMLSLGRREYWDEQILHCNTWIHLIGAVNQHVSLYSLAGVYLAWWSTCLSLAAYSFLPKQFVAVEVAILSQEIEKWAGQWGHVLHRHMTNREEQSTKLPGVRRGHKQTAHTRIHEETDLILKRHMHA
jgi:hypothetical protein